jgi:hypothetical protein
VAQLGARFHGMEEVIGSIPIRSTKSAQQLSGFPESLSVPLQPKIELKPLRDGSGELEAS